MNFLRLPFSACVRFVSCARMAPPPANRCARDPSSARAVAGRVESRRRPCARGPLRSQPA
eukprot:380265-Pyramimonas_sp.AAC.1